MLHERGASCSYAARTWSLLFLCCTNLEPPVPMLHELGASCSYAARTCRTIPGLRLI
ncbi:hypothetical protein DPMN_056677 [Dreissena polymorpha]|uniref:Uncharacterized protein n=1 Tax=Dreissena polymorpha TaxID=45954 RepID=A0A9D4CUZ8_DREPO|nr:hypothetical protein DPMN_056677 [Dreissena polymorpha]